MSHRERFFTALEVKEPDMVPVTDLGLDPPIVEAITGKKIGGSSFIAISGRAMNGLLSLEEYKKLITKLEGRL